MCHRLFSFTFGITDRNIFAQPKHAGSPEGHGDGKSAIFGIVRKNYRKRFYDCYFTDRDPECKLVEIAGAGSYLICDLDLNKKRPIVPRTIRDRTNVNLIDVDFEWNNKEGCHRRKRDNDTFRYKLIAFDLDGTLIRNEQYSWTYVWEYLGNHRKLDPNLQGIYMRRYLRQKFNDDSDRIAAYRRWCDDAVDCFAKAGLKKSDFQQIAKKASVTKNLESTIERLRRGGFKIAIVSGGIDTLMYEMIPNLKALVDRVYINELHFSGPEEKVCGVKATPYDFEGKLRSNRSWPGPYSNHAWIRHFSIRTSFPCSAPIKSSSRHPFERFTQLKQLIEQRKRWHKIDSQWSYFEADWKPKSWDDSFRFIFTRKKNKKQRKGPLQLFEPVDFNYDYKVTVTNKSESSKSVVLFHNGRGSQEAIFGDGKNDTALNVVPCRRLVANQVFTTSAMMAHNLSREIQMRAQPAAPRALVKRPAVWKFEKLDTIRHRIIQRAGRICRPQGKLTLTMSANHAVKKDILHFLNVLQKAA